MGFKIKPNLERYVPYELAEGWGILDLQTGEILKQDRKHRIERYAHKHWAVNRCKKLNNQLED